MPSTKTRGQHIRLINNLQIKYLPELNYFVLTPDKKLLKKDMTLEDAELYCANNKDYIIKKGDKHDSI
jgi:hypothetical protein